jgi:hypothetical protein
MGLVHNGIVLWPYLGCVFATWIPIVKLKKIIIIPPLSVTWKESNSK